MKELTPHLIPIGKAFLNLKDEESNKQRGVTKGEEPHKQDNTNREQWGKHRERGKTGSYRAWC